MEEGDFKSSLDLLFDDIKVVIENRFKTIIKEKNDLQKIILQLPIVKNIVNQNKNLLKQIKLLELKIIENNIEKTVDKKMNLEILELPKTNKTKNVFINDTYYNNSKRKNDIYSSNWGNYTQSSSEDDSDNEYDSKPITITNTNFSYSSLVKDLTTNIKNEKDVLLNLIKPSTEEIDSDGPQQKQLDFYTIKKVEIKENKCDEKEVKTEDV